MRHESDVLPTLDSATESGITVHILFCSFLQLPAALRSANQTPTRDPLYCASQSHLGAAPEYLSNPAREQGRPPGLVFSADLKKSKSVIKAET